MRLEKGEFGAILKLFTPVNERIAGTPVGKRRRPAIERGRRPAGGRNRLKKEIAGIKKVGNVTLIPKALAEKLKAIIISSCPRSR